ncbi:T9SS type B sorting domain-containing protein [Seonamhaeicola sp. NFXS20]|uniref:T9SS type B sorting domain-containing protein n=1 Tax=Seonamhaeicola sp. NFXS20 TaxID=2816959 RepID=UPI003B8D1058
MCNKAFLFFAFLFIVSITCSSQNTFIPDDNFEQALIDLGYDTAPLDDYVPTANITSITELDVSSKNILDLTGIEDFINLSILECTNNQLTNINISNNLNLTQLFVDVNNLTNLDVTNNTNLQILWCFNNTISTLNVSQNPNLISLRCDNNNLSNLDVSNNLNLNVLTCGFNSLTSLNISNNTSLNRLECGGNLLSNLDVSNNIDLSYLSCNSNQISTLNLTLNTSLNTLICFENELTELDLSQNSSLTTLNCSNNNLCLLNINNGNNNNTNNVYFESNTNLSCVVVDNPSNIPSNWEPATFLNYVSSENECDNFVAVDDFNNVTSFTNYTLPTLSNGNYYTEPDANGLALYAGDIISESKTIYIYNETVCFSNETSFYVTIFEGEYFIPKYFTPNNDGTNDTWKVIDNTNSFTEIYIYNRHGKLLKTLHPSSFEWDGTFNGKLMYTDDYWFVIYREADIPIKGHFTLKR